MAGPRDNLKPGRDLIRKSGIELDPPTHYDHYLGCGQYTHTVPQAVLDKRMATMRPMLPKRDTNDCTSATNVREHRHDMLGVTDRRIDRYLECVS